VLPAAVSVEYWNGRAFVPVAHPSVTWATASEQPTTIRFDKIATTQIRLIMTSAAPGTSNGFVQIAELQALGDRPRSTAASARSASNPEGVADDDPVQQTEATGCAIAGDSPVPLVVGLLAGLRALAGRRARSAHENTPADAVDLN